MVLVMNKYRASHPNLNLTELESDVLYLASVDQDGRPTSKDIINSDISLEPLPAEAVKISDLIYFLQDLQNEGDTDVLVSNNIIVSYSTRDLTAEENEAVESLNAKFDAHFLDEAIIDSEKKAIYAEIDRLEELIAAL